ncbi:MAG TPA: TolC family protein [Thermoanaerobaculia bacterium]|nr:TolC family protein [Thermoanaerobaculia bacterium]HUM30033.1 TolC family protein [Thermoanaerobaculia bacterium]HXK68278.1 TolC family protein [Thermoanaerobaculia bacterium]
MLHRICFFYLVVITATSFLSAQDVLSPAEDLVSAESNEDIRSLLNEVIRSNPDILASEASARAAAERAPQVRSLPDPMVGLTTYIMSPETRLGPQRLMASLSQTFPWFGKLKLREKAALFESASALAGTEAQKLDFVTRAREHLSEIAFLDGRADLIRQDMEILSHFEELARTRYISGTGLQQAILKIQSEITLDEQKLLDIQKERARRVALLNGLMNRSQEVPILSVPPLPEPVEIQVQYAQWREEAVLRRPELAARHAMIQAWEARMEEAKANFYPDITAGLTYTAVGRRSDADPSNNGRDILGLTAGINLPIHRERRTAALEEATQRQIEAEHLLQSTERSIDESLGDLSSRLPLLWNQWILFRDVLTLQAQESLNSTLAAYSSGTLGALELLDSERVLLNVRISSLRTQADIAGAFIRLEGVIGAPLALLAEGVPPHEN